MSCEHDFHCAATVVLFKDKPGLGQLELVGACTHCDAAIEFLGMECGINMNGPAVSPDNREVRLAITISTEPASLKYSGGRVRIN